jgi:serine/threonine protein kinase
MPSSVLAPHDPAPPLQAVDTIHRERIVHSDLKPANFLVVEGQLKLIDFGIAKAIQSGEEAACCMLPHIHVAFDLGFE